MRGRYNRDRKYIRHTGDQSPVKSSRKSLISMLSEMTKEKRSDIRREHNERERNGGHYGILPSELLPGIVLGKVKRNLTLTTFSEHKDREGIYLWDSPFNYHDEGRKISMIPLITCIHHPTRELYEWVMDWYSYTRGRYPGGESVERLVEYLVRDLASSVGTGPVDHPSVRGLYVSDL